MLQEEAQTRPSAIPGLLPDEIVAPVAAGAGVQLLQRMGWRQGKGIGEGDGGGGEAEAEEGDEGGRRRRRWGREAGVGPQNTPLHLLAPKTDTFGLGYDPFRRVLRDWPICSCLRGRGNSVLALGLPPAFLPAGVAALHAILTATNQPRMRAGGLRSSGQPRRGSSISRPGGGRGSEVAVPSGGTASPSADGPVLC